MWKPWFSPCLRCVDTLLCAFPDLGSGIIGESIFGGGACSVSCLQVFCLDPCGCQFYGRSSGDLDSDLWVSVSLVSFI